MCNWFSFLILHFLGYSVLAAALDTPNKSEWKQQVANMSADERLPFYAKWTYAAIANILSY